MNFASMNSENLLGVVPAEDDKWEKKSAEVLNNKGELKRELGKQISAFSNSGGGYLVFGIADKTGIAEPCAQQIGRQPMKDYLSTMTEQSVEQPIRDFSVHRIPFNGDESNSMFVIEVGDSQAAPHQAKDERQYYYRIDGHSKPAPHFHLELLRNRLTKTILSIGDITHRLTDVVTVTGYPKMCVACTFVIKNDTMTTATEWGLHIRTYEDLYIWSERKSKRYLKDGVLVRGEQKTLLPGEVVEMVVEFEADDLTTRIEPKVYEQLWDKFGLFVKPVSQNHVGECQFFGCQSLEDMLKFKRDLAPWFNS